MSLVLVAVGWMLLVLPRGASRWLRRGSPRETVTLVVVALVTGATVFEAGLVTCAAPTVLRTIGLTDLAIACQRMFDTLAVGGPAIGWIVAAAAVITFAGGSWGVLRVLRVRRRAVVELAIGEHSSARGFELVVVPTDALVAYGVGKPTAQIVVSAGLVDMLDATALDVLVAHEAGHLQLRHDRHLLLGAMLGSAFVWLPGVRSSVQALRIAVERCADDHATARAPTRRAALRRALLATSCTEVSSGLAAFGEATGIVERIRALQAPPCEESCPAQRMAWTLIALLTSAAACALALWVAETHAVLAIAGYCPS